MFENIEAYGYPLPELKRLSNSSKKLDIYGHFYSFLFECFALFACYSNTIADEFTATVESAGWVGISDKKHSENQAIIENRRWKAIKNLLGISDVEACPTHRPFAKERKNRRTWDILACFGR